jgi:hypothetical protein
MNLVHHQSEVPGYKPRTTSKGRKAPTTLVQNPLWRKKITTKTVFLGPKIEILQGGNPRLPAVSGSSIALQTHNYRA